MIKAFIFDVDGTLADTERDGHRVAFNQAFEQAGLDWFWSVETYAELLTVTGGKERILHYVNTHDCKEKEASDLPGLISELHARKTENYVALLNNNAIPLRNGVKRLLVEARQQGMRLAIATTTTPQNVTALLQNALGEESIGWFEVIGAGDIVPHKKPAPDIYHYVLAQMNLQPNDCIAFEDSYNGLRSSLAANLKTIITFNSYTRKDDFSGALLVLDQFGEEGSPSKILQQEYQQAYLDIDLINHLIT